MVKFGLRKVIMNLRSDDKLVYTSFYIKYNISTWKTLNLSLVNKSTYVL